MDERGPGLKIVHGEAFSRSDGETVDARHAECSQCDGIAFVIYWIEEQDQPHIQCLDCGTSYCVGHACKGDASV